LEQKGVAYKKIIAEENADLATKYAIRQAPTMIVGNSRMVGLGEIRKYISGK